MSGVYLVEGQDVLPWTGLVQQLMDTSEWPQPLLYDYRYVVEKVFRGEWQLWLLHDEGQAPKLMMLTWGRQLPFGKMCFIELVCGEGLMDLIGCGGVFDNWLRFQNIDLVQSSTRPEIARMLAKVGWQTGNTAVFRWRETVQ